jgi:outer membrane protein assembly factor BamB
MSSRKTGYCLFALFVSTGAFATGADWLFQRGDPQRTGWQKDEKILTVHTVKGLRLLWKRQFNGGLTAPLLLGPIITHRGIKELVFVRDRSDTVYAVDADLGTVFWTRHLENTAPGEPCADSSRIAPVMAPAAEKAPDPAAPDDDQFSDANRPLYVLSADGRLYALRPSTGGDFSPPRPFLPASVKPVSLEISDNALYAAASAVCEGLPHQIWTLDLKTQAAPQSRLWRDDDQSQTTFKWKSKDLIAETSNDGQPVLSSAKDHSHVTLEPVRPGGLATWQDAAGTRWIDTTSSACIKAFQVAGSEDQPATQVFWTSRQFIAAGPPVIANNALYFLSATEKGNLLTLHALDALNGRELYNSGSAITSRASSKNLALANGHICLSAADGTLYCFGLPFEM